MPLGNGNAFDEFPYFDCVVLSEECPFVRLKKTGQILKVHEVCSHKPCIRVSSLDDSATWGEHPRDLTWLSEMEVLAHAAR